MGRAAPCGGTPCPQDIDVCTQFGPIDTWVEDDWDVAIGVGSDPLSTATVTGWGSDELEVTATIGTTPQHIWETNAGVAVSLTHKQLTYRHYRHWTPLNQITARCELALPTRPSLPGAVLPSVSLFVVDSEDRGLGNVRWVNGYQEQHVRRANGVLTPLPFPACAPAWDDGYRFRLNFGFPGWFCVKGQTWTTKIRALEWRIGSACESYLAPSPGNDALRASLGWPGLTDGILALNNIDPPDCAAYVPCFNCGRHPVVTVQGDAAAESGGAWLGVGFVYWPECNAYLTPFGSNGSFFYACPFGWDPDIADWAIHHRGHHYLAGNAARLTAGGLTLNCAPYRWRGGGTVSQDPACGPEPYVCVQGDICENLPSSLSVSLVPL